MSGSEASASLTRLPSPTKIKAEHHIVLVDHTVSRTPSHINTDADNSDNEASSSIPQSGSKPGLSKRLTNNSLRQTVRQGYNKQKYSKYGQDRYNVKTSAETLSENDNIDAPQAGQEAAPVQKSYIERAQNKALAYLKRKRTLGTGDEEDTIVDVLYENQRGMFLFGIPKYSSNSLLPSDPRPWQNGHFRTSAVDIRNAQVPDPSWEWAWKSWYVDMSRDVDEEGWEYSFAFVGRAGATFAWHGNHPWFHSFVRRRRWLRMRKRKDLKQHTKEKGHQLTADYFTIHPKTVRPISLSDSVAGDSTTMQMISKLRDPILDVEKMEVSSIGDLFLALRRAGVDREKIRAIQRFIDEGGEELYYLSDRMEDIMRTLVFQSSRKQLLGELIDRHGEVHQEQERLASHQHDEDDRKQAEHDRATRRAENLHKAVAAADEQVRKLEYWSDVKGISDAEGEATEGGHNEASFKNKQRASAGFVPPTNLPAASKQDGSEKSKKSSIWFDAQQTRRGSRENGNADLDDGGDDKLERYTTASETSDTTNRTKKSKEKGKARALDGVMEEQEAGEDTLETLDSPATGARGIRRSVQIVDPVPASHSETDP
ncbi:hypothetical protein DOTSEDRAFT_43144 [Dothistroma septosporum NZE10]|uniref:Peroxin/Ferlin domain-containing protein n=1 Tax=Dothistroma septosporum (strain NZE10 / CBS 128990) TaxID=675120 RepID=N1PWD4_DOTSN|nr:hypothetical protein DOTSEDRAFT_43144 [Dothistroma septosporum NZE10]